jgi:hypothetical protein
MIFISLTNKTVVGILIQEERKTHASKPTKVWNVLKGTWLCKPINDPVAQWIERQIADLQVAGSIPVGIAQAPQAKWGAFFMCPSCQDR